MERLTRPNINVDPDTDRFLHATIGGKEIDWKQNRDSTLNVLINGPTSNGFGKDIFRKMARDLYGRLKAYEDTGLTPEEIKAPFTEDAMINLAAQALGVEADRLCELAEADKDGRVVVLPCKVGDTIYFARANPILQYKVTGYEMGVAGISQVHSKHVDKETGLTFNFTFRPGSIGKTVFLTREEAERAMQEMEGKKDD
nr:MAG TPA: Transcriptional regulator protein (SplA) [Caudoviricetes sp.]